MAAPVYSVCLTLHFGWNERKGIGPGALAPPLRKGNRTMSTKTLQALRAAEFQAYRQGPRPVTLPRVGASRVEG